MLDYADQGYLPEALLNFLAITGWAIDDKTEILSGEEMAAAFDLADLNPAPAAFNSEKLEWMNGVYMRQLPEADLAGRFAERLDRDLPDSVERPADRELVAQFTPLIRERVKLLSEVAGLTNFFFAEDVPVAEPGEFLGRSFRKQPEQAAPALAAVAAALEPLSSDWRSDTLEAALRALARSWTCAPATCSCSAVSPSPESASPRRSSRRWRSSAPPRPSSASPPPRRPCAPPTPPERQPRGARAPSSDRDHWPRLC